MKCSVEACDRVVAPRGRKGMCRMHYERQLRGAPFDEPIKPNLAFLTVKERLAIQSRPMPSGCIEWTGGQGRRGYGQTVFRGRTTSAHRAAYIVYVGEISDGLVIDHLCRNHACINPAHLEPVTQQENVLRGDAPTAINARKTHCYRGHALTPNNLFSSRRNERRCKACFREREARYRDERRARRATS